MKASDIEPVTNSKINSGVTLIYQNTDTIHRVDNKRILDPFARVTCLMTYDIIENYPNH